MDVEFDPTPAIDRAMSRIADLTYPLGDIARAHILGQETPIAESDVTALARRIAQEELDRAQIEQGFSAE
jgi:hypothetical protein